MTFFAAITDPVFGKKFRPFGAKGRWVATSDFFVGVRFTAFALVTIGNYSRSWPALTITINKVD